MQRTGLLGLFFLLAASLIANSAHTTEPVSAEAPYFEWKVEDFSIKAPLGGLKGNAARGRAIAGNQSRGNCLACHLLPIPEEPFFGNLGPPLTGIGSRQSIAMIRLHVVDQTRFNPETVMPGYYRSPEQLNRVVPALKGKTWLNAQEVEDVVAYLVSLKN
ncbi:MAG: sulfur oxidation c-type cytochrome SoxX [Pseudomonadota bacterium]|nr:sulfur oxidation c-type cytochrome SoxX [Pseudomonadota bacterium]